MPLRVLDVLDRTASAHATLPAVRFKHDGRWHSLDWRGYRERVRATARGLMALGLGAGEHVVIIGFNRLEWFLADLGAIAAGGVPAGIYTTSSPGQCEWIARHCDARIAVVENEEHLAKFLAVRDQLPALRAIVLMEGESDDPTVWAWPRMMALGATVAESALEERLAAQRADDVCTLIYTSGTTGEPKAVMLTHDNLTWTAAAAGALIAITPGDDAISYLPLSHIAEQITTLHGAMQHGACTWFAESMEKLGENLRDVRPHYFLGVPRVWEKMMERMQAAGAAAPPAKRKLVRWARELGLAGGYATQSGGRAPTLYAVADALVFRKVRRALGLDRARVLVTSAAPIAVSTLEFFLSLGLPICEVYGMSECTGPATISVPTAYRTGRAGRPFPGTELRVADDGEICMRGRHVFAGYFNDAAATADTVDADGWLHSGDIGMIDEFGYLRITDRKKELIITAGGENVAPQFVEGQLKSIPLVSQAVAVGDRQRYIAVLLTLDPQKIPLVAAEVGSPARDLTTAIQDERVLAYLQREIDRVNARLARVQTVKRFAVIPTEFSIEGGELTPTMKLRRRVIAEKYEAEIRGLYL